MGLLAPAGLPAVNRVLGGVDHAVRWAELVIVVVMVVIVGVQVGLRYLLNVSLDWADELSRLAFVWMVFLGIPLAARVKSHIAIDLLAGYLPAAGKRLSARLLPLACAVIATMVAYQAAILAFDQWDELMASLDWSAQWFIVPVALGMVLTALFFVEQAFWPLSLPADAGQASGAAGAIAVQRTLS